MNLCFWDWETHDHYFSIAQDWEWGGWRRVSDVVYESDGVRRQPSEIILGYGVVVCYDEVCPGRIRRSIDASHDMLSFQLGECDGFAFADDSHAFLSECFPGEHYRLKSLGEVNAWITYAHAQQLFAQRRGFTAKLEPNPFYSRPLPLP